jgi:dipeptidyl aminopeptidase/acylaminoacyl peptidase
MKQNRLLLFAALAIAGLGGAANATGPQPSTEWDNKAVPIEVLAQFPMVSQPKMTADGKWIAAKVRANGEQVLAIMPVKKTDGKLEIIARDAPAGADNFGSRRISDYGWIDPDHLVIQLVSRDNVDGQKFDNVRYASYNRVTKQTIPLGWDKAFASTQLLWASHSGKPHVLIQRLVLDAGGRGGYDTERWSNPEVIDIDVDTGKYATAMTKNPEVQGWVADADGVVRMGSSSDGDTGKVKVMYRNGGGQAMRTVFNWVPDRYNGVALPTTFIVGGKAYAMSRSEGYRALYEYDLTAMKLGKKVFGVDGYDIGDVDTTDDDTALSSVTYVKGRTEQFFFDPRLKEIQGIVEDTFGKGNVYIATTDAKRETILFKVAAMGQAESWYIFDTVTGGMGRFAFGNDTLKDAKLNPVSVVSYPTSDGKKIEAILTMPRHRTGQKNLPLIVLPHGGPWARDEADWDPYVVIQPNYRGSDGYGREWERASEKSWGYRMQDDLNDAIPWLAGQGIVDPKRVCMFGWSYGGYAASRAAERDGDKYRCAISGAGVHDLVAMRNYDKSYLGLYGAKMGMGSASADLIDASPGLHPEKYSIPILIVQGAKDVRVPPSQARDLVARLRKVGKVEGKDFFYLEQPLNTHNLLREADRIQLMQEVKKFLEKFNPA